ncbi:MAG: UDP-N-acetylmuramoyl-tripeptide--D-alanyl-D-alanine ligase [Proteobacteria bacterium]|jgi:UDP-N-acetylmuramoyl-tripeptide--D-alanyl-D-alanine ligase|nr:UDP-N-acetylmuramoyl-tripeptide--D-alanyl-D-alanine ligase [Pseudomonadota bacterium]MBK9252271.1 UDP-N-acetylmuramoyl-tripeptide--D-alanyl-D-alanine ligase [Pseudomonadota bacterium]MCC6633523.1 UDP-N-acetylmuramoyl-tripeptide--D-alanyl-D-alanine ligase [Gammaproteobacteria bacterium]
MNRTLRDFATLCGGTFDGEDHAYTGVGTDTRALQDGQIYLALRGPRFDGNDFIDAAASAGAIAAVVDRQVAGSKLPLIQVADGQAALTAAATGWRERFTGVVVGVAGSNGKTTVKEMTAAILAHRGACLATRGNYNNHIGVPLTLLRLSEGHRSAVIEIGANRPGEVADLVRIVQPDVGLITNAGAEHLEGFGDLDGVARAEGEMVAGLGADDVAIINADDDYADLWRGMTRARVVTFGVDKPADFSARDVRSELADSGFRTTFTLHSPQGARAVRLNVGGQHNLRNALAAAAAAVAAGASLDDVVAGLAAMQPVAGRLQPGRTSQGARLIDDSYNANPSSMRAGIDVLVAMPGRPWMVMGDMGELGDHARDSHIQIGRYARERGVQRLFATGPLSTLAVEVFGAGAEWFADTESLSRAVNAALTPEVTLLVKGSRSNRLERVVTSLGAGAKEMH